MRNTSAAIVLMAGVLAAPIVASAQPPTTDQELIASRDASEFRVLHNPVISADGAWMAAEERPDRGDGNIRVWSTEGDVTFTIERGQNPRISRDSRWVSALQKPLLEGVKHRDAEEPTCGPNSRLDRPAGWFAKDV